MSHWTRSCGATIQSSTNRPCDTPDRNRARRFQQAQNQVVRRRRIQSYKDLHYEPRAYELYLKGKYYSSKYTESGYKKGLEYFQKAAR